MQEVTGILEMWDGDNGRLRQLDQTLVSNPSDPVICSAVIERFSLRPGLELQISLGPKVGNNPRSQKRGKGRKKNRRKRNPMGYIQNSWSHDLAFHTCAIRTDSPGRKVISRDPFSALPRLPGTP